MGKTSKIKMIWNKVWYTWQIAKASDLRNLRSKYGK